jgi:hypothetical protein
MLLGQAGVLRTALILGSHGVAPGLHRLRVGCTVCQYAEPVKGKSLRVVPPPPFPPHERGVVLLDHGA